MEPRETYAVTAGVRFKHFYESEESYFTPCETECPAPVCTCGYFRLEWPAYEAMVAARQSSPL